jgi:predicted heme/steroid binding protein
VKKILLIPPRAATKRKRKKNPPLIQPFKVVIGATAKRGHKTMMWFDGKHFRTTKVKRAMFSSIHNAKVMALSLIKRFPVLSKYTVGIYRAQ